MQRPVPLIEVKLPAPKFDLASSSFPPLPGCVVPSAQEDLVPETRLSDVVRGRWGPDKVTPFRTPPPLLAEGHSVNEAVGSY